jgi:NADH-quinone oxidoreductase subunit A
MLTGYGYVALFLFISLAFAGLMITLPVILRWLKLVPHHPTKIKEETYECGLRTIGPTWIQYNPHYYFFALVMVALDILAVFILPWVPVVRDLGAGGFVPIIIFVVIVVLGYFYAWRKGVLAWK